MTLFILHETDFNDDESDVIGIASTKEKAKNLIKEYYGHYYTQRFVYEIA